MRFSASQLRRWMSCPLQVHFDNTIKRPQQQNSKTTFGTCVHDALEMYNKSGDIEESSRRFLHTWENPQLFDAVPDVWARGTTYGSLKTKGIEILDQYHAAHRWEERDIVASEHKFHVPFGDHSISGVVDLMEVRRSQGGKALIITDYKTSSRTPTYAELALNIQFTVYQYATLQEEFWVGNGDEYPGLFNGASLFEEFKAMPRRGIWHNLWLNKEVYVGERDDNDYLRMYRCMIEVAKAIEAEIFVPNISGDSCGFCPYHDVCQVVAPVRDKLLSTYLPPVAL